MIYQTSKDVNPSIRKSGCYFRVVLRIVEILIEHIFSAEEMNMIFDMCDRVDYIDGEGWMKEDAGQGVSQIASGIMHKHCHVRRISDPSKCNFLVAKYVKDGPHFVLEDGDLNEFFDPWSENGSNTHKNGILDSYRYYFGEKL